MGPRHLSEHLRFLEDHARDREVPDLGAAAAFWRSAMDHYALLQQSEAGIADAVEVRPLPSSMQPHVNRLIGSPAMRDSFATVPVAFGMVDLDRLIISQYSLTHSIVDELRTAAPPKPSGEALASLCLPLDAERPACRTLIRDPREFVFASAAHDLRLLSAQLIDPRSVAGLRCDGHPAAVIAVSVGFSINLLNVVRFGNRLVLNNGHHRAYALRAMGLTRLPCVIQVCGSREELREAASPEIVDNDDLYFDSPRPPMLRDFDNPELARRVDTQAMQRIVRLRFDVDSTLAAL